MEILITPKPDAQTALSLRKHAEQIDGMLDNPYSGAKPVAQTGILEQFGKSLWNISGLNAEELRKAISSATDKDETVRVMVCGDEFQDLPWELLYHESPELGFLGRHPRCAVIRRIWGDGLTTAETVAPPFRILLFVSSPDDTDAEKSRLDYEKEQELLYTALDKSLSRREIDIDVAEDGCFETLADRLGNRAYHAVILSMHGNESGLQFEDADTFRKKTVSGTELAAEIARLPKGHRPGLAVLSACKSAASVATQLHKAGIGRVLGMRLSIRDEAAAAFNAEFFQLLARGEHPARALTLARDEIAKGKWLGSGTGDPFAQWSLPVLFERTADGPMIDISAQREEAEPIRLPTVLDGDKTVFLPQRAAFIGRRREIREFMRDFLNGKTRAVLFTGPGGVGKTAIAGLFARTLWEKKPNTRILGFQAPFDLHTLYEPLREQAFDGEEEPTLQDFIAKESDRKEIIRRVLVSLANRKNRPLAIVLDNLESLQDMETLAINRAQSLWFLKTVCQLPAPVRILLTGRYTIADLAGTVAECPVNQAPYADILCRMERLNLHSRISLAEKRRVYAVLGGNHRAVEWMAQLMNDAQQKAKEILTALEKLKAPPDTPEIMMETVLEAMRENLLFSELLKRLSPAQNRVLCAASLYRVPVNEDGLTAIGEKPEMLAENRNRLLDYSLLEKAWNPVIKMDYFLVPPVVKSLLKHGFREEELKDLHEKMGRYHRFQGKHVSKIYQDYIEAVYHFRLAEKHVEADELANYVADFYYRISSFAEANALAKEIVERKEPPAPCWALNQYGLCQYALGFYHEALFAYEKALPIAPNKKDKGTILNNISQIYDARGDYDTALKYLEQSLGIRREIGDKSGEGTTLNNISQIYDARGDYDTAISFLEQSLAIFKEIGDKKNEGTTLNNISQIYDARGDYDTALKYLEQSLGIRREIGDKSGEGTTLNNISQI
ncbi:MAG: tetratricopeptide repeat protein [Desulfococcaceae bacterium]